MKLPIPAAVPHAATTESLQYISPVSSSIDAKLDRNVPEHRMYRSVPRARDSSASRVSNELIKLPVPAAVLHVATTESSRYISPVSSSIDAKLHRNVPEHRMYRSVPRAGDSSSSRVSNELMKLPVPTAVLHVVTTESSQYISPVSNSIDA